MDFCTLESGSVWVTDKFTIQERGGGGGVIFSAQFPLRGKHPIQFRYVPAPGYEPERDCNWQPLDSQLDLNIDETETWQRGLCSTFWFTSCYTDPFYCQINSVSGLQYVRAVQWCHSVLGPTWVPSQSKLMSTQKQRETRHHNKDRKKRSDIKANLPQSEPLQVALLFATGKNNNTENDVFSKRLISKVPAIHFLWLLITHTLSQGEMFSAGEDIPAMSGWRWDTPRANKGRQKQPSTYF